MEHLYSIDVLLATYDGEKFIRELLESIGAQTNVQVHLIVSDDGSKDSTLSIVNSCSHLFSKVTVLSGPKQGPSANFFQLLKLSESEYVAFADQDDVWEPQHLFESIQRIQHSRIPALTFSATREFEEGIGRERIWPISTKKPEFPNALFENMARGCTIVLNSTARTLINSYQPKYAIMHDWWVFLVILLKGFVLYSPSPEVKYRIHENNHVGIRKRRNMLGFKTILIGDWKPISQIAELLIFSRTSPILGNNFDLESFYAKLRGSMFDRIQLALNLKLKFRDRGFDDFRFRVGIILMPLISRNMITI